MLVATYNIHYGIGRADKLDLKRAIDAVRHADIIALQEIDRHWDRSSNQDQLALIADLLPEFEIAWGPTIDVRKPATPKLRRQYGNMILSRFPIVSIRNYLLPKYGSAEYLDIQKGALEALIDTPIGPVRFYSLHLCSTSAAQSHLQMQLILDHHHRAANEGPVLSGRHSDPSWTSESVLPDMPEQAIMLGDFNFEDTTQAYTAVVGEWSERYGHLTKRSGLVDAWTTIHGYSEGARKEGWSILSPKGRRVDYGFVSQVLAGKLTAASVDRSADGSDHQPIFFAFDA